MTSSSSVLGGGLLPARNNLSVDAALELKATLRCGIRDVPVCANAFLKSRAKAISSSTLDTHILLKESCCAFQPCSNSCTRFLGIQVLRWKPRISNDCIAKVMCACRQIVESTHVCTACFVLRARQEEEFVQGRLLSRSTANSLFLARFLALCTTCRGLLLAASPAPLVSRTTPVSILRVPHVSSLASGKVRPRQIARYRHEITRGLLVQRLTTACRIQTDASSR